MAILKMDVKGVFTQIGTNKCNVSMVVLLFMRVLRKRE
jgi:hypothetical protein